MSLFRWVGSKRWAATMLADRILSHQPTRYIEPFLGGGAVFFEIASRDRSIDKIGNDSNSALMNAYHWISVSGLEVNNCLERLVATFGDNEEGYTNVRKRFNGIDDKKSLWDAAAFIYLNALCFNGLWRSNSKGAMNVPWGKRNASSLPNKDELIAIENITSSQDFMCDDFGAAIEMAETGTAIYGDPPYYETFNGYRPGGFSEREQLRLATMLHEAHQRGAIIYATNTDCPQVREIYSWATKIELLEEPRRVAANGNRDAAKCVLIIAE